jgi:hypothetical protein
MHRTGAATYALMLSIVIWGVIIGGVVYSHIVYFPVYLSALPDSAVLVNGPYALNEARFWVPFHSLAILSLIVSLALNWRNTSRRKLILLTLSIYIVVIIATSFFFLPELFAFADSPNSNLSPAEWLARGNRWQYLSWIRGTVMLACIVPLLFALVSPERAD